MPEQSSQDSETTSSDNGRPNSSASRRPEALLLSGARLAISAWPSWVRAAATSWAACGQGRNVPITAIGSDPIRRATNDSNPSESGSAQCRSSSPISVTASEWDSSQRRTAKK